MIVVMLILSLAVIVTGVKVRGAYNEQKFFSQTQRVSGRLSLAQDLMLIMDADVRVHIGKGPGGSGMVLKLDVEKPLSGARMRLIEQPMILPDIGSYSFVSDDFSRNGTDDFVLDFIPGRMTRGTLTLFEHEKGKAPSKGSERFVTVELPGYPSPIGSVNPTDERRFERTSSELYPEEVYEKLYKKK